MSRFTERRIIERMRRRRREALRKGETTDKIMDWLFYVFLFLSVVILGLLVAYLLV